MLEVVNGNTIEDDFHTAIIDVGNASVYDVEEAIDILRNRLYLLRGTNRIQQRMTLINESYADNQQTKATTTED